MKVYAPNYYDKFKCIADKCKHSCCVGWEIDIDEESLERYKRLEGEFGERVRKNISFNAESPHFITDNNEKCPFLNERGLCDMINELGEESLCEICAVHPRFRNFYSDRVEIGLGLCCEAAAELVLSYTDKIVLTETEESDTEVEEASAEEIEFFALRERLLRMVQDRGVSIFKKLVNAEKEFGVTTASVSAEAVARLFASLEYMCEDFGSKLYLAFMKNENTDVQEDWEIPLEQLAVYFIMRHTADGIYGCDTAERVALCSLCVEAVYRVCIERMKEEGMSFFEALCDTARIFSSEIEYSTENVDRILEFLDKI